MQNNAPIPSFFRPWGAAEVVPAHPAAASHAPHPPPDADTLRLSGWGVGGSLPTGPAIVSSGPMPPAPAASVQRAATRVQATFRGHLARRRLRAEAVGARDRAGRLIALLDRRQGRPPAAEPASGRAAKRPRISDTATTPPAEMNGEQRLKHLKGLYAEQWRAAEAAVDKAHPQVLARVDGQRGDRRRVDRAVRAVREEVFVRDMLPADAPANAGFFSPRRRRVQLCHQVFEAPCGDLEMADS